MSISSAPLTTDPTELKDHIRRFQDVQAAIRREVRKVIVGQEEVIEHVTEPQGRAFLREAHRALKPGGTLRLTTPDLAAICRLYDAVASLPEYPREDARGRGGRPGGEPEHPSARPAARERTSAAAPGGGVRDGGADVGLVQPVADGAPAARADRAAGPRGGGA